MRLSDVLSKEPNLEFQQVDGFLKRNSRVVDSKD